MVDNDDQSHLPPIPDGGLADSMPEWLRRPPAWRTLPDRDVVQTEPVETAALPEPDTSVIDPRTFLSDDDLPLWLRNLGRGRAGTVVHEPAVAGPESRPELEALRTEETPTSRFVPATPPAPPEASASQPRALPERPTAAAPSPRWWQGGGMVTLLAALLLIAIVAIVFLAIS
jgi:hypothetical protein